MTAMFLAILCIVYFSAEIVWESARYDALDAMDSDSSYTANHPNYSHSVH